jgi:ferritin-like metal-binding protein YciE
MPTTDRILADAFHKTLKEVYFTEKLSRRVRGRAARRAQSPALRRALERQCSESASRVRRLDRLFALIGHTARSGMCPPIQGITVELQDYLNAPGAGAADAVLICWALQVEAFAIGRYEMLRDWSCKLELAKAGDMIEESSEEWTRSAAILAGIVNGEADRHPASGEVKLH